MSRLFVCFLVYARALKRTGLHPAIGLLLLGTYLVLSAVPCQAEVILTAKDCGFYNSLGRHSKVDGSPSFGGATPATFNYSVGLIDDTAPYATPGSAASIDVFRKNYFTFDLSGYTPGSITGGTLKLFLPASGYADAGMGGLTYKLYGSVVPDPIAMGVLAGDLKGVHSPFVAAELAKSVSLFGKLGDTKDAAIPEFGSVAILPTAAGTTIEIPLTSTGISYLNLYAGGEVVLAGEIAGVASLTGLPDTPPIFLFGSSSPVISGVVPWSMDGVTPTPTPTLSLATVPEPNSILLTGVLVIAVSIRKRKRFVGGAAFTRS